jgi:hypothetical protein
MGQLERQADSLERWLIDRYPDDVSVRKLFSSDEDIG